MGRGSREAKQVLRETEQKRTSACHTFINGDPPDPIRATQEKIQSQIKFHLRTFKRAKGAREERNSVGLTLVALPMPLVRACPGPNQKTIPHRRLRFAAKYQRMRQCAYATNDTGR